MDTNILTGLPKQSSETDEMYRHRIEAELKGPESPPPAVPAKRAYKRHKH